MARLKPLSLLTLRDPSRWQLPFKTRYHAGETFGSFFNRLRRGNYCEFVALKHRAWLAASVFPDCSQRSYERAVELLGGLPEGTFGNQRTERQAFCSEAGCECARPVAENRFLCIQCAKGERVRLADNLEPFVCVRHQRWTGPDAETTSQPSVRDMPSFTRAAVHHRRLLRAGRFDALRFRTLWAILAEAYVDGALRPPEVALESDWRFSAGHHGGAIVYPSAIALYELLENPVVLGDVLDPANDLDAVESKLARLVERAVRGHWRSDLVRKIRYSLRSDFYRVALATTPGWHDGPSTNYPPPRVAPHDRDLSDIDFRRWPTERAGIAPGFPGFDSETSPMHIVSDTGPRFRYEFWHEPRGRRFEELKRGQSELSVWICRAGHVSRALLGTRNRSGRMGCGLCVGREAVPGVTDIATTHPDAFRFWDHTANLVLGLKYWAQTAGRDRLAAWQCGAGHTFELPINTFLADPHCKRCDVPNQRRVNLREEFSEFLSWWDEESSSDHHLEDLAMYSEVVAWRCPDEHHPFRYTLQDLQRRGGRCPVCTHRQLVPGVNDLQTLNPDVAEEFSLALNGGVTPDQVWPATPLSYLWVCRRNGHVYRCSPRERTVLGIGCTKCTGRQIEPGETDLGTVKPAVSARWHAFANGTLTPADVHPGSPRRVYWTCLCDEPYKSEVRYMRVDRYCRRCTDELRRWARKRGLELDQLFTSEYSGLVEVPGQTA